MDFINTIKSETDRKYNKMLDGTLEAPFHDEYRISSQSGYTSKHSKYIGRLNAEKSSFNSAVDSVVAARDRRLYNAKRAKDAKALKRFKAWQAIKTLVFLLPLVLCIPIGYDVFNASHGQMYKLDAVEHFSLGWAIALYVIFCVICVVASITLIVRMFLDEDVGYKLKRYSVMAIIVLVIVFGLTGFNVYRVASTADQVRVNFIGGDKNIVKYANDGSYITLPDCSKSESEQKKYTVKYKFKGWDIGGELYQPNDKYRLKGAMSVKAVFDEEKWATVKVSSSNATVTLHYNGNSYSQSNGSKVEILVGTEIKVTASFSYSDTSLKVGGSSVKNSHVFILKEHTTISASSSNPGCLVEGTQITLYDGSKKAVEDLQIGDVLAVFNHETGRYEAAPLLVNVHANVAADYYDVMNLRFTNGKSLRIVDEHALFDKTLNQYVNINRKNFNAFIGHTFVVSEYINGEMQSNLTTLDRIDVTRELVKIFNPASVWHINLIANDMLTFSAGMVNLFEYDDNMQYDAVAMERDIAQYGLYTYDDFKDYIPIEVFNAFPFKYYKVAIEKGEFTFDRLLGLIRLYNDPDSVK